LNLYDWHLLLVKPTFTNYFTNKNLYSYWLFFWFYRCFTISFTNWNCNDFIIVNL